MPQLGELLERFRRPATPGPPAATGGVPGDVAADLQSELRPLIAALDEVEDEAQAIVDAATAEAAALRQRGARDAELILDEARSEAVRLRAAPVDRGPDGEAVATIVAAEAEAEDIRRRARARIPGMVARVLACMRDGVDPEPARGDADVAGVGRR